MKHFFPLLLLTLTMGSLRAAVIFDIGDVVRPGGSETANTVIFGTGLSGTNYPASMDVTEDSVEFSVKNGFFVVYFTPKTLAVGETIQLSYNITFTNADSAANAFRVGLFNSAGGTVFTSDQSATTSSGLYSYQGYFETQRVTLTNAGSAYQRSSTTSQSSLFSVTNAQNIGSPTSLGATNGVSYDAMISLTRTGASSMRLDSQFGNQELQSFEDTDTIANTFNAFAFQIGNTSTDPVIPTTMTFTELTVSVVPEPTAAGLLLSGLAVAFGFFGRTRKTSLGEG